MKYNLNKLLLAIVGLFLSTAALAHDFVVNRIYYNILDQSAKTVEVTYKKTSIGPSNGKKPRLKHSRKFSTPEYSGIVRIPSSVTYNGTTYSVTSIGNDAFYNCKGLTSITIPNSVTEISEDAFHGCSNLTSIVVERSNSKYDSRNDCNAIIETSTNTLVVGGKNTVIPNSVTSIGSEAFYGCSGLTSITIPNSVTSIGEWAFYDCSGLTSITIPNSVTDIYYRAFDSCTSLAELIIEEGTETLSLGYKSDYYNILFYNCPLEKLHLGRNLTSDYPPFNHNSKLKEITIGNSVTEIGDRAFYNCSNIHSLTIGSGISSIPSDAFNAKPKKTIWLTNTPPEGYEKVEGTVNYVANNQYSSLSNVKVYPYLSSIFEVDGVKYVPVSPSERTCDAIDCAYSSAATDINISNTVSYKGVAMTVKNINPYTCYGNNFIKSCTINFNGNIGKYAFYACEDLESLDISANNIGEYAFNGCKSMKSLNISVNDIGEYAFNDCKSMKSLNISGNNIGDYAFSGCSAIENVKINTTTIGVSAFQNSATTKPAIVSIEATSIAKSAFRGCSAVNTITLGNKLKTIGNSAFYDCKGINAIVIPNSVTSLGESSFYNCSSLTSATIGNAVETINSSTFYNCSLLENITIGDGAKSIGNNAFYGCKSLFAIEIPKNVISIGNSAFEKCSNLSDVIIKDRITVLTLGSNNSKPLFSDCPLDSVYIGGDISYKKTSDYGYSPFYNNKTLRAVTISNKETEISENEFYGCANLKSVSIGDRIMSIGNYAFSGCSSLKSFAFGSNLKTIGKEAFSDCSSLVKLSSKATIPPICEPQALDDINKWECELYVPDNAISAYKGANQWKEFFFINPKK